jgi:uncharacterized protein (TIGR03790 family)
MKPFQRATSVPSTSAFGHARSIIYIACLLAAGSATAATTVPIARASITPADLGIIIAQGDPLSEAIGAYYQSARGIPAANVVRIALPTSADNITPAQLAAFKAQVDAALPANVQATVLTWTRPFRVQGACGMSITSAFALGYATTYCGDVPTTPIPYFNSDSTHPWQDYHIRPSMMLGADTLDAAKALIDRGVRSDGTYPSGDGYLIRTSDADRSNPRYADFSSQPAYWNFTGGLKLNYIDNAAGTASNFIVSKNPVLFYFTGMPTTSYLGTNAYVPGAIGDSLTSFGGILSGGGQTTAAEWLAAGATGSYGTVEEPRAYPDKFPKASVVIDQYYRGATLIEAYWKSVRTPGEGLFVGEPLARPFADLATSTIEANQYVVKTRSLRRAGRYSIESRIAANYDWTNQASIWVNKPGPQEIRGPVADANAEVRLVGPCSSALTGVSAYPSSYTENAQGGRTQRVYFELQLFNSAAPQSNCTQDIKLSAPTLPDGLIATFQPPEKSLPATAQLAMTLRPQELTTAIMAVDVPATVAQTSSATYSLPFQLTDARIGTTRDFKWLNLKLAAATDTGVDTAPLIRFRRPTGDWFWTNYPRGSRDAFFLPVEVDTRPDSGITAVVYTLQATALDSGEDPTPYNTVFQSRVPSTSFAWNMYLAPRIAPGVYHLVATGHDKNFAVVSQAEIDVYTDIELDSQATIDPTPGGAVGTSAQNYLFDYRGPRSAQFTGGTGHTVFSFSNIVGMVPDAPSIITNFKPGVDSLDLAPAMSRVLANLGIKSFDDAYKSGFVTLVDTPDGLEILVRTGVGTKRVVRLSGVTASAINMAHDIRLRP